MPNSKAHAAASAANHAMARRLHSRLHMGPPQSSCCRRTLNRLGLYQSRSRPSRYGVRASGSVLALRHNTENMHVPDSFRKWRLLSVRSVAGQVFVLQLVVVMLLVVATVAASCSRRGRQRRRRPVNRCWSPCRGVRELSGHRGGPGRPRPDRRAPAARRGRPVSGPASTSSSWRTRRGSATPTATRTRSASSSSADNEGGCAARPSRRRSTGPLGQSVHAAVPVSRPDGKVVGIVSPRDHGRNVSGG